VVHQTRREGERGRKEETERLAWLASPTPYARADKCVEQRGENREKHAHVAVGVALVRKEPLVQRYTVANREAAGAPLQTGKTTGPGRLQQGTHWLPKIKISLQFDS
jgi:hypothetical protein